MDDSIKAIERDQARIRRDVFVRQVCYSLLPTIRLRAVGPNGNPDQVRAELTDDSVRVLAPLVEAVEILEAIIWASDGCIGIVETFRLPEVGDTVFVQITGPEGLQRVHLPPSVTTAIARQRDALTTKARSRAGKARAAADKAAGIAPGFLRGKRSA